LAKTEFETPVSRTKAAIERRLRVKLKLSLRGKRAWGRKGCQEEQFEEDSTDIESIVAFLEGDKKGLGYLPYLGGHYGYLRVRHTKAGHQG